MTSKDTHHTTSIIILLMCMTLLGYMWFSLSSDIEESARTGKPFELNKKFYQAVEVSAKASPTPPVILEPTPSQDEINERVTKALRLNPPL